MNSRIDESFAQKLNDDLASSSRAAKLYTFLFSFEKSYESDVFISWVQTNWTVSLWCCFAYVVFLICGKAYMQNRPRFQLRTALAMWSGSLAIFSIMGTLRTLPEFADAIWSKGLVFSMCNIDFALERPTSFWMMLFALSKIVELGDTVFIILRKQQLLFLHWYHHMTVLFYAFYTYSSLLGPARWFVIMNYAVHSLMYSYYTLKALQFRVHKLVSMTITLMQLTQMITGMFINMYTYHLQLQGQQCHQTFNNFIFSIIMYTSYFILFAAFFYNTYMTKREATAPAVVQNGKKKEVKTADRKVNGKHH